MRPQPLIGAGLGGGEHGQHQLLVGGEGRQPGANPRSAGGGPSPRASTAARGSRPAPRLPPPRRPRRARRRRAGNAGAQAPAGGATRRSVLRAGQAQHIGRGVGLVDGVRVHRLWTSLKRRSHGKCECVAFAVPNEGDPRCGRAAGNSSIQPVRPSIAPVPAFALQPLHRRLDLGAVEGRQRGHAAEPLLRVP